MTRIILLSTLLFLTVNAYSQSLKKKATSKKNRAAQSTLKKLRLEFSSYSFGDLPHYIFKDISTGKEMEVEFDKNESGYKMAKKEIDQTCDENEHCKMAGKKYNATLQYKLVDIYDWNGERLIKTGKKEKRWILTKLSKANG